MTQNDTENELSPRQRRALEVLCTGGKVAVAAKEAGVSRVTLSRWQREPVFAAELRRLEGESLRALGRRLLGLGEKAGTALEDALGDDMPIGARLRAADLVTSRGPALAELTTLIERIEALEAAQHDSQA